MGTGAGRTPKKREPSKQLQASLKKVPDWVLWIVCLLASVALVLLFVLTLGYDIDANKLSLHYFYRDRLVEAYLQTLGPVDLENQTRELELKRDNGEMLLKDLHGDYKGESRLSDADAFERRTVVESNWLMRVNMVGEPSLEPAKFRGAATAAPYHLISTCLNLTTDRDMRIRSRKSDIFLFSKLFCGSESTGFVDTGVYRSGGTKVARAMTISGAAADSAMGARSFFAQSFASTLFNIRLGQWLENPAYHGGAHVHRRENGIFWLKYMLMEIFGMGDVRRRLIHLSIVTY